MLQWDFVVGERDRVELGIQKKKWEFIARSRMGVQGWNISKRKPQE